MGSDRALPGPRALKVVPPGPKNPLCEYKMRLAVGDGTYEIHETNNTVAVGLAVTHGCIRMWAALLVSIPVGTKVWLTNEPVKIAYEDGKLLIECQRACVSLHAHTCTQRGRGG
jgi:L,D-transpeptidase ErfK/SrfK